MKRYTKRVLSLLLGLALLLSVVPASVFATTEEEIVETHNPDHIWDETTQSCLTCAETEEIPATEDVAEEATEETSAVEEIPETTMPVSNDAPATAEVDWNIAADQWYVWDFSQGSMTNTAGSDRENTLSLVCTENSEITSAEAFLAEGTLHVTDRSVLKMSKKITLKSSDNWTVALVAKTDGKTPISTFLSTYANRSGAYFFISTDGDLSLIKKGSCVADNGTALENEYLYYKVSDADFAASVLGTDMFDPTQYHSYQVACRNGVLSFWLDGQKIGNLAMTENTSKRGSGAAQYTQGIGTPFDFSNLVMQYVGCGTTSNPASSGLSATVKMLSISTNSGTIQRISGLEQAAEVTPMITYPGQQVSLFRPDTGDYCAKLVGWAENPDGSGKR